MKKLTIIIAIVILIGTLASCGSSRKGGCSKRPDYTPDLQF